MSQTIASNRQAGAAGGPRRQRYVPDHTRSGSARTLRARGLFETGQECDPGFGHRVSLLCERQTFTGRPRGDPRRQGPRLTPRVGTLPSARRSPGRGDGTGTVVHPAALPIHRQHDGKIASRAGQVGPGSASLGPINAEKGLKVGDRASERIVGATPRPPVVAGLLRPRGDGPRSEVKRPEKRARLGVTSRHHPGVETPELDDIHEPSRGGRDRLRSHVTPGTAPGSRWNLGQALEDSRSVRQGASAAIR